MAAFAINEKLHSSAKVASIPRRHRLAAMGLWTMAGSWCVRQGTGGFVPDFMVPELGATPAVANCLVEAALWHVAADGEDAGYCFVGPWDRLVVED